MVSPIALSTGLLATVAPAIASAASAVSPLPVPVSPPPPHYLNLSHRHDLIASSIAKSVRAAAANSAARDEGSALSVDISSTLLGDDGILEVMNALVEILGETRSTDTSTCNTQGTDQDDTPAVIRMDLAARTNRLTSEGAAFIFDTLAGSPKPKDAKAEETANEEGDDGAATTPVNRREETDAFVLRVGSLDISMNDLFGINIDRKKQSKFAKSLERLVESSGCPSTLHLECCGLGPASCRAIGKGLLNAAAKSKEESAKRRLKTLHLSGNSLIGDAGAAALAAALRTSSVCPLVDDLDLSGCGISDVGCEAIAMAIRDNPDCIRSLDLSNNKITDDGAVAIGLAAGKGGLLDVDLSNNKGITDRGASALAAGIERGAFRALSVRSCDIRSEGAAAFGRAIRVWASSKRDDGRSGEYSFDLSGNLLGTMQVKKKKGSQYSANLLKSKASAQASAYMGFLGKKLRSGLQEAGIGSFVPSAESDDDEEELMGEDEILNDTGVEVEGRRCGARAFSDALIGDNGKKGVTNMKNNSQNVETSCLIGFRHCFLDEKAANSFAAAIIHAREALGLDMSVDSLMNTALESDVVETLSIKEDDKLLSEMADRYFSVLEALQIARQRAREAAEAAAARARAENAFGNALGEDDFGGDFGSNDDDVDYYDFEGGRGYGDGQYDDQYDEYDDQFF